MIKRLIFDVDNTLIEWKNEYWNTLQDIFDELNIEYTKDILNGVIKAIDTYEEINNYYNKQKLLNYINEVTKCNFDIKFLDKVLKSFEKCVPNRDEKIVNVLNYLSKNYELFVLTNWFKSIQENRLRNFGILHFFNDVYAGETFKIKPHKESFIMAMGNRLPEECIMIGDNLEKDIYGAINVGMRAIYINPKSIKEEKKNYMVINNIIELKEIL